MRMISGWLRELPRATTPNAGSSTKSNRYQPMSLREVPRVIGVACLFLVVGQGALRLVPNEFPMNSTSGERSGHIELRIKNGSNLDFDRVLVHLPDEPEVD